MTFSKPNPAPGQQYPVLGSPMEGEIKKVWNHVYLTGVTILVFEMGQMRETLKTSAEIKLLDSAKLSMIFWRLTSLLR